MSVFAAVIGLTGAVGLFLYTLVDFIKVIMEDLE